MLFAYNLLYAATPVTLQDLNKEFNKDVGFDYGDVAEINKLFKDINFGIKCQNDIIVRQARYTLTRLFNYIAKYQISYRTGLTSHDLPIRKAYTDDESNFKTATKLYTEYKIKFKNFKGFITDDPNEMDSIGIFKPFKLNKLVIQIGIGSVLLGTTFIFLKKYLKNKDVVNALSLLEKAFGNKPFTYEQADMLLKSKKIKLATLFKLLRQDNWLVETDKGIIIPTIDYFVDDILFLLKIHFKKDDLVTLDRLIDAIEDIPLNKNLKKGLLSYMLTKKYFVLLDNGVYKMNC